MSCEEEKRETVSLSILNAMSRLTYDHELADINEKDINKRIRIEYINELMKLYLFKLNNIDVDVDIKYYLDNKEKILGNRLRRFREKKSSILGRKDQDWRSIEEEYRSEELRNLAIIDKFVPNADFVSVKRACYNDIYMIRNYLRTINNIRGEVYIESSISEYRNLELKLFTNEDYIIVETINDNGINYGYLVNKRNYFDYYIIKIVDINNIYYTRDGSTIRELLPKFNDKLK